MKKLLMSLVAGAFLVAAAPAKAETIAYVPGVLYVGVQQVRYAPPPPPRVVYVPVRQQYYAPMYHHRHGYDHPKYVVYKKKDRLRYDRGRDDHHR